MAEGVIKGVIKVGEAGTGTSVVKRIVIPKEIAEAMQIQKGDQLLLEYWGGEIRVKKF
jgi:AbrB family looped-hinge helix DNA binding protein